MREMQFAAAAEPWFRDPANVSPLAAAFDAALPAASMVVRPLKGRAKKVNGWTELVEWMREVGSAIYRIEPENSPVPFNLKMNVTDVSVSIECDIPIDTDSIEAPRTRLRTLLMRAHAGYCRLAKVGPILAITLRDVPYERPSPPTEDPQWPAGAITLAACQRFFTAKGTEERARFEALGTQELPSGVVRHTSEDLLLIETESSELKELGGQRHLLEKWIGETLSLQRDQDFLESGDKRVPVWEKNRTEGLGFYDGVAKIVYKGVAELKDDELDAETLKLLNKILRLDELPDGREVLGKRVVFVGSSAALRWLPWVRERGGSVAYLGQDDELWDPAPE